MMTTLEITLMLLSLGIATGATFFCRAAYDLVDKVIGDTDAVLIAHEFMQNLFKYIVINGGSNRMSLPKKEFKQFVEKESNLYRVEFEDDPDDPKKMVGWVIRNP